MQQTSLMAFTVILGSLSLSPVDAAESAREKTAVEALQALGNAELAALGAVDVTAAPFLADPRGSTDSTSALQKAIDFARDHQMVCFFPKGEYLVSDTLNCEQYRPMRGDGRRKGTRDYPCVLVGSRRSEKRPQIVLVARAAGFGNPQQPKYVVHFWSPGIGTETPLDQPQPNISMNQMLIGIDVVIGEGNSGAVGIRHCGAQGSGVENCTIDVRHGLTGLEGGCGSGGSHANVTVIGGRIGVDIRQTQPAPTITGFTLIDQTETAILCESRQSLCAVGLRIESQTSGPLIVTTQGWGPHHGQLCLIDSQMVFRNAGPNTAIEAGSSLYMNNVYVRQARAVVRKSDGSTFPAEDSDWTHVKEYALGIRPKPSRSKGNLQYEMPVFKDGKRLRSQEYTVVQREEAPPSDLQSRHLWDDDFPHWELPEAVSVKAPPYNAVGDGIADDSSAVQRAIDENAVVFLPNGSYGVSKTIRLHADTKLLGVHRCYSWLVPLSQSGGDFDDPSDPQPVVQTDDDVDATTVLAFLGIRTLHETSAAYCLNWRAGRHSIFRDTNIVFAFRAAPQGPARSLPPNLRENLYNHPIVLVDGQGGGRWYNFHQESSRGHGIDYRHLLVDGTTEPLRMYQCNPEHARSDANMELRGARYVSIYGLKGEYNQPIIWVRDCDHVRIFGYGGNGAAHEGRSLLVVERTPNFLLANLVDSPRLPQGIPDTYFAGDGVDPRRWHMVSERSADGREIFTPPLDRPVLYKRGEPSAN